MNPRAFNSARFNLAVHTPQARQMLLNSNAFQNYLGAVGTNASQGLEEFKVPLLQQWEILKSLSRAGNGLTGIDETSVNSSLISFLQAITGIDPAPSHEWRSSKIRLHANFGIVGNAVQPRQYVAITDGQLQDIHSGRINTIIECKSTSRNDHAPQVQIQEVSQIVAWIKQYRDPTLQ